MCGIIATFNVSAETVEKMVAHQSSRGPDNSGISGIGGIIFGHNRLSIIDPSENGNQPISQSGLRLTYNGELYQDIRPFPNDTLFLHHHLYHYAYDLIKALNGLRGMFAFAFHDNAQQIIYLVRDRFGVKPLYYHVGKNFFAAASTPAAVSLTKNGWEMSKDGLQEYLSLGATMLHSMFEGILAVPPGHYVEFNCKTQEVKVVRWYYPKYIQNASEFIEDRVRTAIDRVKLTCDWPQIILLSGGIDSTLVASRYEGQGAIHLRSPEQEHAERVAKKFDIQLHTVDPEETNAEEALTDYISKSGDPTMAGLIPYITCKEIAKLGYRVAITANGADELFFGYERMKDFEEQRKAIFREFTFMDDVFEGIDDVALGVPTKNWPNIDYSPTQWREIYSYLMFDLNKTLDFASMCHSVEVRVPYLDHELVEAALSIPMETHTGQFGNKSILKKMLNDLGFDWSFIHRPKMGFSLYHNPPDWNSLQDKAMKWYEREGFEQPINPTGRQQAYHQTTVVGLYLWSRIWSKV